MQRLEVSCAVRHNYIYIYVVRRQRFNACRGVKYLAYHLRNFGPFLSKTLNMFSFSMSVFHTKAVLLPHLPQSRICFARSQHTHEKMVSTFCHDFAFVTCLQSQFLPSNTLQRSKATEILTMLHVQSIINSIDAVQCQVIYV